jgi:DNA invertase Pin-like site-specific DNA recombinase
MKAKQYVSYLRCSTSKQTLGIEAQRRINSDYISSFGGEIIAEFVEHESGKIDNRIELHKALDLCDKHGFTLLIAKLDRLSRNISFIFQLRDSGIDIVIPSLPELTTMTLGIFATLAQSERETISLRTKQALGELKAKGIILGKPNNLLDNLDTAINNSVKTRQNKAKANENNVKAAAFIRSLRSNGTTWKNVLMQLNQNGFKASKGGEFRLIQAQRLYNNKIM